MYAVAMDMRSYCVPWAVPGIRMRDDIAVNPATVVGEHHVYFCPLLQRRRGPVKVVSVFSQIWSEPYTCAFPSCSPCVPRMLRQECREVNLPAPIRSSPEAESASSLLLLLKLLLNGCSSLSPVCSTKVGPEPPMSISRNAS